MAEGVATNGCVRGCEFTDDAKVMSLVAKGKINLYLDNKTGVRPNPIIFALAPAWWGAAKPEAVTMFHSAIHDADAFRD